MEIEVKNTLDSELIVNIGPPKIITAIEARNLVTISRKKPDFAELIQEKLEEASKLIEKAAKSGKIFVDIATNYTTVTKMTNELEKLGFTVRNGGSVEYIRVNWEEKIERK